MRELLQQLAPEQHCTIMLTGKQPATCAPPGTMAAVLPLSCKPLLYHCLAQVCNRIDRVLWSLSWPLLNS